MLGLLTFFKKKCVCNYQGRFKFLGPFTSF